MFGGNGCNFIASTLVLHIDWVAFTECVCLCNQYDENMTWWYFSHYWNFASGIHQSPVDSLYEVLVMRSFDIFFDINQAIKPNSKYVGDLRCHDAHVTCHKGWTKRRMNCVTCCLLKMWIKSFNTTVSLPSIGLMNFIAHIFSLQKTHIPNNKELFVS